MDRKVTRGVPSAELGTRRGLSCGVIVPGPAVAALPGLYLGLGTCAGLCCGELRCVFWYTSPVDGLSAAPTIAYITVAAEEEIFGQLIKSPKSKRVNLLTGINEGGEDLLVPLLGCLHKNPQRSPGRQHGHQVCRNENNNDNST